jgi:hypothetical protein
MKIFTGEEPENPCEKCHHNSGDCINCEAATRYQFIQEQTNISNNSNSSQEAHNVQDS